MSGLKIQNLSYFDAYLIYRIYNLGVCWTIQTYKRLCLLGKILQGE
jgi:hypothetical protein